MQAIEYVLGILLACAVSDARSRCKQDLLGATLEYMPDAWQLIDKHRLQFHLMFTSKGGLNDSNYKCLTTLKTEAIRKYKWERKLFYSVFPNENTTRISWSVVGSRKASECHVYDNLITASDSKGRKKPDWRSNVLYTDYKTCVLLSSRRLGYQVWAAKDYVREHREIPYICVLLYEVYAGLVKHWVYDWNVCSSRTSKII
uniref:Putative conserved secreted protein n=1 Tax=Amblyomma tuberculatum TaxID=48802 RepID=A0A6M2E4Q6_9ACAR